MCALSKAVSAGLPAWCIAGRKKAPILSWDWSSFSQMASGSKIRDIPGPPQQVKIYLDINSLYRILAHVERCAPVVRGVLLFKAADPHALRRPFLTFRRSALVLCRRISRRTAILRQACVPTRLTIASSCVIQKEQTCQPTRTRFHQTPSTRAPCRTSGPLLTAISPAEPRRNAWLWCNAQEAYQSRSPSAAPSAPRRE